MGRLVVGRPGCSAVLERLGIDYRAGGRLPLADACARSGLNPRVVIDAIVRGDAMWAEVDTAGPARLAG